MALILLDLILSDPKRERDMSTLLPTTKEPCPLSNEMFRAVLESEARKLVGDLVPGWEKNKETSLKVKSFLWKKSGVMDFSRVRQHGRV